MPMHQCTDPCDYRCRVVAALPDPSCSALLTNLTPACTARSAHEWLRRWKASAAARSAPSRQGSRSRRGMPSSRQVHRPALQRQPQQQRRQQRQRRSRQERQQAAASRPGLEQQSELIRRHQRRQLQHAQQRGEQKSGHGPATQQVGACCWAAARCWWQLRRRCWLWAGGGGIDCSYVMRSRTCVHAYKLAVKRCQTGRIWACHSVLPAGCRLGGCLCKSNRVQQASAAHRFNNMSFQSFGVKGAGRGKPRAAVFDEEEEPPASQQGAPPVAQTAEQLQVGAGQLITAGALLPPLAAACRHCHRCPHANMYPPCCTVAMQEAGDRAAAAGSWGLAIQRWDAALAASPAEPHKLHEAKAQVCTGQRFDRGLRGTLRWPDSWQRALS